MRSNQLSRGSSRNRSCENLNRQGRVIPRQTNAQNKGNSQKRQEDSAGVRPHQSLCLLGWLDLHLVALRLLWGRNQFGRTALGRDLLLGGSGEVMGFDH